MKPWGILVWVCVSAVIATWPFWYDRRQRREAREWVRSLHGERVTLEHLTVFERKGKPMVFLLEVLGEILRQDTERRPCPICKATKYERCDAGLHS